MRRGIIKLFFFKFKDKCESSGGQNFFPLLVGLTKATDLELLGVLPNITRIYSHINLKCLFPTYKLGYRLYMILKDGLI
jgi:hypothetical protein